MLKKMFLLSAALFLTINTRSEVKEFKYGKIEESELSNNICPIDSNAGAYIIGAYGKTFFNYVNDQGFQIIFECKLRIKILKNNSFDLANYTFPIYEYSRGSEKYDVNGITFNLENGKIIKSKLTKDGIFKEKVSKNRTDIKISMPNIREGSVIDIEYSISSDYNIIRDWYFQENIPVLVSQYIVRVPEYYVFKKFLNGHVSIDVKQGTENSKINFVEKERHEPTLHGGAGGTTYNSYSIDYITNVFSYTGINIPAFKIEPYLSSRKNYISFIEFELESYQFPHSQPHYFTKDWESICKELLEDEEFGGAIKGGGFIEETVAALTTNAKSDMDKAAYIYSYVKANMKWNGYKRLWSSGIKKAYNEKTGNSADINFLLIVMLRKAGIKADPVILSTRDNGIALMAYPVLSKFNYVIAAARIGNNTILMDATNDFCPFGMLPERCLNGKGRVICEPASYDVDLKPSGTDSEIHYNQLSLNGNNELTGLIKITSKGYRAVDRRSQISDSKSTDEYLKLIQNNRPGLTVEKFRLNDYDSIYKPLSLLLDSVLINGKVENNGNIITFNPLLYEQTTENPFKIEERKYPVDYAHPIEESYFLNFTIPEGYAVDELPKPFTVALPENAGKYIYNTTVNGNMIQVSRKFNMNKIVYVETEYKNLKEFYNQIVAKEAQLVVLKKIQTASATK